MPIRAVTLDAAGTLFGVAEPVGATYARVAAAHGIPADPTTVERRFRAASAGAPPLAFPGVPASRLPARERAWWRRLVASALDAPPGPALDAAFDTLFAHYARGDAWRVFPDVRPALAALRGRGLRLAVVSNFDARLLPLLGALDLDAALDAVVHSTGAGSAKPAPAIFRTALALLGVTARDALHAGDDPAADVAGALGAGMSAALIARGGQPDRGPPGVPILASLARLDQLVDGA